jgi:hypothetical protein
MIIMWFISMLVLSLNYNKINNLNTYIFTLIYLPLGLITFTLIGFTEFWLFFSFCVWMDFSFVFVLGLDNNITPNIPSGSNNPGGIPGPSGNHNNSLGLANNDDPGSRNRRNRRTLANINHTSPHKLIFDSTSRREKYEKTNYAYQLAVDAWNVGMKKELYQKFCEASNLLDHNPRSLTYLHLGVLKKTYVEYNHLLGLESKQLLHGLAQREPIEDVRTRSYSGLRIGNLIGLEGKIIARDTKALKLAFRADIIRLEEEARKR